MSRSFQTLGGLAPALVASATLLPAALPATARAQSQPPRFVRTVADASRDDLARLAGGTALVKTLASADERELAQAYAVRVRAPVSFILDQIRERHLLLDDAEGDSARGVFGRPAGDHDLRDLDFTRAAIRDLEQCRPRRCDVKLPAGATERLHREVDWESDTAGEEANRFLRRVLLEIAADYGQSGARVVYEDKSEPLAVAEGFEKLFEQTGAVRELDGEFHEHLRRFPESRAPGVEDLFSWTIEDLGTKSLVSLNHIAIRERSGTQGTSVIGIKRFYASHYFQASVRIITLSPATGDPTAPDTYVAVLARFRFDGELGGIKRVATERRLERSAERSMAEARDLLEALYRD